jgi:hypothetical protein
VTPTPLHRHTRAEEAFYVLSGRLAVWLDGTEQVAEPGAFLLVPRGVPHAARRVTDEPVRMLTLVSPSGLQRFFSRDGHWKRFARKLCSDRRWTSRHRPFQRNMREPRTCALQHRATRSEWHSGARRGPAQRDAARRTDDGGAVPPQLPRAQVELGDEANHLAIIDQTEVVADHLKRFLSAT